MRGGAELKLALLLLVALAAALLLLLALAYFTRSGTFELTGVCTYCPALPHNRTLGALLQRGVLCIL